MRERALRARAARAHDAEDARYLMEALGLLAGPPARTERTTRRRESSVIHSVGPAGGDGEAEWCWGSSAWPHAEPSMRPHERQPAAGSPAAAGFAESAALRAAAGLWAAARPALRGTPRLRLSAVPDRKSVV